jgi:hypothetical protein
MRVARDLLNASTTAIQMAQSIETDNSIPLAGKTVTLSFYARAGANYSAASNALSVYLQTGTGTNQNYYSGFTGASNIVNGSTATLTTTWQRFTFTASVGSTATQLAAAFVSFPVGIAGAADLTKKGLDFAGTKIPALASLTKDLPGFSGFPSDPVNYSSQLLRGLSNIQDAQVVSSTLLRN